MGRPYKQRRRPDGAAWYWKQTDCRCYTLPGTKKRIGLFDEEGQRIRPSRRGATAATEACLAKLSPEQRAAARWHRTDVSAGYPQVCAEWLAEPIGREPVSRGQALGDRRSPEKKHGVTSQH
jgi:hypothetical protein